MRLRARPEQRAEFLAERDRNEADLALEADDGVEILVHVGIDTVNLAGKGFQVSARVDERVEAGDLLAKVDLDTIREAGYDPTTIVVVINTAALSSVTPRTGIEADAGDPVIDVEP